MSSIGQESKIEPVIPIVEPDTAPKPDRGKKPPRKDVATDVANGGRDNSKIWEQIFEVWRKYKRCPDDESLTAYAEGYSKNNPGWFWRKIRVWRHVRGCVFCRSEVAALREVLK